MPETKRNLRQLGLKAKWFEAIVCFLLTNQLTSVASGSCETKSANTTTGHVVALGSIGTITTVRAVGAPRILVASCVVTCTHVTITFVGKPSGGDLHVIINNDRDC